MKSELFPKSKYLYIVLKILATDNKQVEWLVDTGLDWLRVGNLNGRAKKIRKKSLFVTYIENGDT